MTFHYLFFIGSVGGFFLELFYRKLRFKKWIKPGVFKGIYLPLYGMGLVICYLCFLLNTYFVIKVIMAVLLLTFIEFVCGIIFIEKFKIPLWDYSNEIFNYKGLICLKFSFIWMLLSVLCFGLFKYIDLYINNIVILIFEVILIMDVLHFFIKNLIRKKKRNFDLDL